jgi:hypothetical protein
MPAIRILFFVAVFPLFFPAGGMFDPLRAEAGIALKNLSPWFLRPPPAMPVPPPGEAHVR